eukprot:9484160-Pyramimonas_sp.AAC.1
MCRAPRGLLINPWGGSFVNHKLTLTPCGVMYCVHQPVGVGSLAVLYVCRCWGLLGLPGASTLPVPPPPPEQTEKKPTSNPSDNRLPQIIIPGR